VETDHKQGMLLGKHTPVVDEYSPQLLYPIPRSEARQRLGLHEPLPFTGVDLWHAYEMSWLDHSGKPVMRVGRFHIPADSLNMVESKSFKLYLNSLNNTRFEHEEAFRTTVVRDISEIAKTTVKLDLFDPVDPSLAGIELPGIGIDERRVEPLDREPGLDMLKLAAQECIEEQLYSHLLRSLCPVTGQPDWATVWIHYRGAAIDHSSLLQYIIAYRQHQEFHEQCVERMFRDISQRYKPDFLHIQAFYTRRGGLDINPFRSTDPHASPLPRLDRQ
jgi:7-cyano-7-deazaguanine reductase